MTAGDLNSVVAMTFNAIDALGGLLSDKANNLIRIFRGKMRVHVNACVWWEMSQSMRVERIISARD
jgi:hypothetical protein